MKIFALRPWTLVLALFLFSNPSSANGSEDMESRNLSSPSVDPGAPDHRDTNNGVPGDISSAFLSMNVLSKATPDKESQALRPEEKNGVIKSFENLLHVLQAESSSSRTTNHKVLLEIREIDKSENQGKEVRKKSLSLSENTIAIQSQSSVFLPKTEGNYLPVPRLSKPDIKEFIQYQFRIFVSNVQKHFDHKSVFPRYIAGEPPALNHADSPKESSDSENEMNLDAYTSVAFFEIDDEVSRVRQLLDPSSEVHPFLRWLFQRLVTQAQRQRLNQVEANQRQMAIIAEQARKQNKKVWLDYGGKLIPFYIRPVFKGKYALFVEKPK